MTDDSDVQTDLGFNLPPAPEKKKAHRVKIFLQKFQNFKGTWVEYCQYLESMNALSPRIDPYTGRLKY